MQLPLYLFDPSRSAPDARGEDRRQTAPASLFPWAAVLEVRVFAGLPLVRPAARKRNLLAEQASARSGGLLLAGQVLSRWSLVAAVVVHVLAVHSAFRIRARPEGNGVELAGNPGNEAGVHGRGGPLRTVDALPACPFGRRGR